MAMLQAFAAVFPVADVAAAIGFYRDRLGFAEQFRLGGDAPGYAIMDRDAVSLHLMPGSGGGGTVYVFVADVDALHADCAARGCPIEVPPTDFDYGMREFSVRDPDGNRLTFGRQVAAG